MYKKPEPTKLTVDNGKTQGIKSEVQNGTEWILGYEPYFQKDTWIGSINHEQKVVRPCHGYFPPHKHSKTTRKIAEQLGYEYNAN